MAQDVKPRVRVPKKAARGEVVEIKTLISHVMESGQRKDRSGNVVPRRIVNRFEARYNGRTVFAADLHPAVAADPYLSFYTRIDEPGELVLTWTDDDGSVYTETATIAVE